MCSHAEGICHEGVRLMQQLHIRTHEITIGALSGGSAGIGKATALAFDKNGCKVAILGRRKERLDAVVSLTTP